MPVLTSSYHQHENIKFYQYEVRVQEIEHSNFSPLVFSTSGGMGASTTVAYKHLALLLPHSGKLHNY